MYHIDDLNFPTLADAASQNLATHFTWVQQRTPGMTVIMAEDMVLTDCGLPCDTFNAVCRTRMDKNRAPERIQWAVDYFARVQRPFSWWLSPGDQPYNLETLLQSTGLEYTEGEIAMAADLDQLTLHDLSPENLQIRRVQTTAELADFAAIVAENWSPPDSNVMRFYDLAAPTLLRCPSLAVRRLCR
jgi:hypothetical protein